MMVFGGIAAESGYKFAQLYVAQMSILFRDTSRFGFGLAIDYGAIAIR